MSAAPVDPFGAPDTGLGDGIDALVKRDQYGRYLVPDPVTGEPAGKDGWTRATTVAGAIEDSYALEKWGKRLVAKGVSMVPRLHALAAATPLEDKAALDKVAQDALEAAGGADGSSLGTALHAFTHRVNHGEPLSIVPLQWREDVAAYLAELQRCRITVLPEFSEVMGVNSTLRIAGTFDNLVYLGAHAGANGECPDYGSRHDPCPPGCRFGTCVAAQRDDGLRPDPLLTVGDLKTGQKLSYAELAISVQLAIYASFDYLYDPRTGVYTHGPGKANPMPRIDPDRAVVFALPVGSGRMAVQNVNIAQGRRYLDLAMAVRRARKDKSLFSPYVAPADLEAIGQQIRTAPTRATLAEVYARWQDVFTDELVALGRARYAELGA